MYNLLFTCTRYIVHFDVYLLLSLLCKTINSTFGFCVAGNANFGAVLALILVASVFPMLFLACFAAVIKSKATTTSLEFFLVGGALLAHMAQVPFAFVKCA